MKSIFAPLCHGDPEPFVPGIFPKLERSVYDRIAALSCSALKKWLSLGEIPSEFDYWMKTRWQEPPTEALLIGSALDCLLLDDDFESRYAVAPVVDRRTNAGKAQWAAFQAKHGGKTILTQEQSEMVRQMEDSLMASPSLEGVFEHCQKTSICAQLLGMPAKAEFDLFNPNSTHLLDLKSCRDVSPKWFAKAFLDFGYAEQATFYLLMAMEAGMKKKIFDFIAVKKEPPWTVKVYSFAPYDDPDHWLLFDACRLRLARAAGGLLTRLERDDWRDDQDWQCIKLPEYVLRQAKLETLQAA
jgi:exodeoxyribonuclease VIII